MRVATWNINGIRARIDYIEIWLKECQPDLVGFQELKAEDHNFPRERLENLGYKVHTHGQKSWNGVAIASKHPVELTQVGLPGEDDNGSRLLTVESDDLSFTTVYCPNGKNIDHADFKMKLHWFDSLHDYWSKLSHSRAIICGDFNIVPYAVDTWHGAEGDGGIFHTQEERARLYRFSKLTGGYFSRETSGFERLFMVGLSSDGFSTKSWSTDRFDSRYIGDLGKYQRCGHSSRLSQKEGRVDRLRPCTRIH